MHRLLTAAQPHNGAAVQWLCLEEETGMKTNSLRINQLSESAYERYLQYLHALDSLDIEAYAKFLADDCEVQSNETLSVTL